MFNDQMKFQYYKNKLLIKKKFKECKKFWHIFRNI